MTHHENNLSYNLDQERIQKRNSPTFLIWNVKYSRNPIKQPGEIERGHLMGVGRSIRIRQELV